MIDTPAKPLPTIDDGNRPFWEGAREGALRLQHCDDCGHIRFPIQPGCPRCLSHDTTWQALSGNGEIYSRIVYHRSFHPAFRSDVPYNVVMVLLDEGPILYSNVVGCELDDVQVGRRVTAVFEPLFEGADVWVPRFRIDHNHHAAA